MLTTLPAMAAPVTPCAASIGAREKSAAPRLRRATKEGGSATEPSGPNAGSENVPRNASLGQEING